MKISKTLLLLLLVAALAATSGACNNNGGGNQNNTTTATSNATGASADKIGVAECDDFLAKYDSCLNTKVPEAARAPFKSGADSLRQSWKRSATTVQGRISLAVTCSAAKESAKQAMMQYGCEW